jgi:hypothetical protein
MSEKIFACLLRAYPSRFLQTYGEEALQLFRDRANDEKGLLPFIQLWLDLLSDFVLSVPRAYYSSEPVLIGRSAQGQLTFAPAFHVLEDGPPRLRTQLCACLLSVMAFCVVLLAIAHGGSSLPLRAWSAQPEIPRSVLPTLSLRSANAVIANGEAEAAAANGAIKRSDNSSSIELQPAGSGPGSVRIILVALPKGAEHLQPPRAEPNPQNATRAIIDAFGTHNIVMFGETHGNKQEYEWLCELVNTPAFADRVDDIVMEFGNSLYQKSVDRYIAGEDVPFEQVERAWRNMIGAVGPPSPVYEQFYKAVRAANLKRRGKHQMRIVLGDPYGDWDKIRDAEDLGPYVAHRDEWYAQVVKDEVLKKNHRALLIMGAGHFRRLNGQGLVEREIRATGANPYLVVFGANVVGGYDDLDRRFDAWPLPAIVSLSGNWVGDLPALPVLTGGGVPATALKLADAADALFYAGPRDALTQLRMPRSELDGTPYGREIARRLAIQMGHPFDFLYDQTEVPQYERPQAQLSSAGGTARPVLPPMPKSMRDPLPPRPPSE